MAGQFFLEDVATAVDSVQDERIKMRSGLAPYGALGDGVVAVFRQAGANAVEVSSRSATSFRSSMRNCPFDFLTPSTIARSALSQREDVQQTLYIAFGLCAGIFAFLGRAATTLIPGWPACALLLITFLAMWA